MSVERETFPELVADGSLYAMASDARWIDAGTPATFIAASLAYAPMDGDNPAAVDSVLGAGVSIAHGARIEGSVLFDDVVVGTGAAVRNSIVGRGARVEAGATVADLSVIGDGAVVPAGATLSGDRLPVTP